MPIPPPLSKYHRIYLVLREQLQEGRFAQRLPGELDLARQFSVGRVTVRRALEQLVAEGLIVREVGRGTRPTTSAERGPTGANRPSAVAPVQRLRGLLGNVVSVNSSTTVRVVEWRIVNASPEVAHRLQIADGDKVRKVVRTRSSGSGPLSHITTWVPEASMRGLVRADLKRTPMLQLLQESGIKLGRAVQTISARQADAQMAVALQVVVGSALLWVRRLVFDAQDRPLQLLHGLYRPDRYQYQLDLSQVGSVEARIVLTEVLM